MIGGRGPGSRRIAWVLALALALTGCIDTFLGPAPDADDPRDNFDALWTEFDRHYSFFGLKGVDWNALYDRYRPSITAAMTESELMDSIASMLDNLQDGHVNVYAPFRTYTYDGWFEPYPVSFDQTVVRNRLTDIQLSPDGRVVWGDLDDRIGYVHIGSFAVNRQTDLAGVVAAFQDKDAIVIDVRSNEGGSSLAADLTAGLFASTRFHYRTTRYRNGPDHDDFSDPIQTFIEPWDDLAFTGPVAVLTNRRTFSAGEVFVVAMRQMPQVTVVGDTTGGGAGNPMHRELPNGWTFRLSRWITEDPTGFIWEGVGVPPDVWVIQTDADAQDGNDPVLDAAIAALEAQLGIP